MEGKIEITHSELAEALAAYNKDAIENPENFGPLEDTQEAAELQADALLGYLKKAKEPKNTYA